MFGSLGLHFKNHRNLSCCYGNIPQISRARLLCSSANVPILNPNLIPPTLDIQLISIPAGSSTKKCLLIYQFGTSFWEIEHLI